MNKEELIKYKKVLERAKKLEDAKKLRELRKTKRYLIFDNGGNISYTPEELKEEKNLPKAIEEVEKWYEEALKFFVENNRTIDRIDLYMSFSTIIPYYEEEHRREEDIMEEDKCLPNLVGVDMRGCYCRNEENDMVKKGNYEENDYFSGNDFDYKLYIVPYNEFVKTLKKRGFKFNKVLTTQEIKEKNVKDYGTVDEMFLTLDFNKGKTLKKQK